MLKGASATLLLTLAARAAASRVAPELAFRDDDAERIARDAPGDLSSYGEDAGFVRGVVLRSALMDEMARDFFRRHPDGTAVSLGAGLCTRRQRLIKGGAIGDRQAWLHVDLPEVVALRHALMPPQQGERSVAASLLDEGAWLGEVDQARPRLIIVEGVCPYLPDAPLRAWLGRLGQRAMADEKDHAGIYLPREMALDFIDPELLNMRTQVGGMALPVQSGFTGVEELMALLPGTRLLNVHHPFARFSAGHAAFEAGIRARTGRALYTIAHLALSTLHGTH